MLRLKQLRLVDRALGLMRALLAVYRNVSSGYDLGTRFLAPWAQQTNLLNQSLTFWVQNLSGSETYLLYAKIQSWCQKVSFWARSSLGTTSGLETLPSRDYILERFKHRTKLLQAGLHPLEQHSKRRTLFST